MSHDQTKQKVISDDRNDPHYLTPELVNNIFETNAGYP